MKFKIFDNDKIKAVRSADYNYTFNKENGTFIRWGKTEEDDPAMSPIGPEILDMEISTTCFGQGDIQNPAPCRFCYKSNTGVGINMSFETAKNILDKMNKSGSLCQVAYGIGSVKGGNPDLWRIMEYTRSIGLIPNITVNGHDIDDEDIAKLANLCGAVAVSHYNDEECFGTVKRLTDAAKQNGTTLRQVNIHSLIAAESYDKCRSVIRAAKEDDRLKDLNAVVLMTLKTKGVRNTLTPLSSLDKFRDLFKMAVDSDVRIGFDSCGAPQVFKAIESLDMLNVAPSCESCESFGLFSCYIDVNGVYYPCSFAQDIGEWKEGLSVIEASDFVKDIWHHHKLNFWRDRSLNASSKCDCRFKKECRPCPLFDITPCLSRK